MILSGKKRLYFSSYNMHDSGIDSFLIFSTQRSFVLFDIAYCVPAGPCRDCETTFADYSSVLYPEIFIGDVFTIVA